MRGRAEEKRKGLLLAGSLVTAVKEAYRRGSKVQRAQLRSWMRRVLSGEDGKP
jgi:hypothetical protein